MRILFYSWSLDPKTGGGVAVYLNNLFRYLENHPIENLQIFFLSSGKLYDGKENCYIQEEKQLYGIRIFTIINSPIIAPVEKAAADIDRISSDTITKKILSEFIDQYGPFDVIHFHSFEGISTNVLSLKHLYPNTKFLHSVHDYCIMCPKAKLWNHGENCLYSPRKFMCHDCLKRNLRLSIEDYKLMRSSDSIPFKIKIKKKFSHIFHTTHANSDDQYRRYRDFNRRMINTYSDGELCVSRRVAEIMESEGFSKAKLIVNYIGTKVASMATYHSRTDINTPRLTILFMGYATEEKGIFVYLDSLRQLGPYRNNIILKFASVIKKKRIKQQILKLRDTFKDVIIYDGYTHQDFPTIMEGVNLGIVPPLWEDNLPQVAIEMIANGIPVITSMHGGAKELNSDPNYRFNDAEDLSRKITNIYTDRDLLSRYWKSSARLTTMDEHVKALLNIYNQ